MAIAVWPHHATMFTKTEFAIEPEFKKFGTVSAWHIAPFKIIDKNNILMNNKYF